MSFERTCYQKLDEPVLVWPGLEFHEVAASIGTRAGTAVRSSLALAALPVALAMLLLGGVAGLLRRHKVRDEYGFASLTFSYLGKLVAAFSVALYAFTALSPLGPPVWRLYAAGLSGAAGATLYFGNLPPKI